MSSGTIVAIVILVIIVALVVAGVSMAMRRRRLQQRFGPEYDRAVESSDSRRKAEAELTEREKRVRKLDIRPLDAGARDRYASEWRTIQEQFVDTPAQAVTSAQSLITSVMTERGYPTEDAEQITADLSVEHAGTIDEFRTAQELSSRAAGGTASTEDLRQAMVHYRTLFRDLLGERTDDTVGTDVPTSTPVDEADMARRDEPVTAEPARTGEAGTIGTDTMPVSEIPADVGPDYAVQDFDYPAPDGETVADEPARDPAPASETQPAGARRTARRR
ncbi:MAG TPA: hypothetical protein VGG35_21560 [Streptosporangiaceae bacterium]|jgi:hypothetical protein